jgi:hypothetical protein
MSRVSYIKNVVYFLVHYYREHDQPNPLHTFQNNVLTNQLFFYLLSINREKSREDSPTVKYPTEKVIKICE